MRGKGREDLRFPAGEMRFVADITVGKTAKWLRILGFDTLFMRSLDMEFLAARLAEGRILVTRDSRLANRPGMSNTILLEANDPAGQVADIFVRLGLAKTVMEAVGRMESKEEVTRWPKPLSRCIRCNAPLKEVPRSDVVLEVPDFTWATQPRFHRCPLCRRVYWPGTHRERILSAIDALNLGN